MPHNFFTHRSLEFILKNFPRFFNIQNKKRSLITCIRKYDQHPFIDFILKIYNIYTTNHQLTDQPLLFSFFLPNTFTFSPFTPILLFFYTFSKSFPSLAVFVFYSVIFYFFGTRWRKKSIENGRHVQNISLVENSKHVMCNFKERKRRGDFFFYFQKKLVWSEILFFIGLVNVNLFPIKI